MKCVVDELKRLYEKYREMITYLIAGGAAFVVSIGSFYVFSKLLQIPAVPAHVLSQVLAILFAYVTNKLFVFRRKTDGFLGLVKEAAMFFAGRLFTMALSTLMIHIFVNLMGIEEMIIKVISEIFVILLNYVISKFIVFKKDKKSA